MRYNIILDIHGINFHLLSATSIFCQICYIFMVWITTCCGNIILHIHGMNLHMLSATSIFFQLCYIFMVWIAHAVAKLSYMSMVWILQMLWTTSKKNLRKNRTICYIFNCPCSRKIILHVHGMNFTYVVNNFNIWSNNIRLHIHGMNWHMPWQTSIIY